MNSNLSNPLDEKAICKIDAAHKWPQTQSWIASKGYLALYSPNPEEFLRSNCRRNNDAPQHIFRFVNRLANELDSSQPSEQARLRKGYRTIEDL